MTKTKRLDGKKKLVSLTRQMQADIRSFCMDKGVKSEAELIRQAIAKYIYADYADDTLKLHSLKQLQNSVSELRDIAEVSFNYIRLMHVSILSYHPEIDPQLADAAFASANARHSKFFEAFQDSLKNNPPFFERLLHKYYSGDADGKN
jgi:hypothetical protein